MPARYDFATCTAGPAYWGEQLGAALTRRRLRRVPQTRIADATSGVVRVRGQVRLTGPGVEAPISGRRVAFARLLSAIYAPNVSSTLRVQYPYTLAEVSFGGAFAIEDESGRAVLQVAPDDRVELLVRPTRLDLRSAHERGPALELFEPEHDVRLDRPGERVVIAEWAIAEGMTISAIGAVLSVDVAPSEEGYRELKRVPVIGPREGRGLILFS